MAGGLVAAGLLRRLAALVYDSLILAGISFFATLAAVGLNGGKAFAPQDPWLLLELVTVSFVFLGWCWIHGGQTPGMRAWNIRVSTTDGLPLTWQQALIRYLVASLSLACLGAGYLWMLVDAEKRTWHDRAARTTVIRIDRSVQASSEAG
ncbi:MAG: hypothetical protein RLZZ226_1445 [Pseudomonadota bacterium]